MASRREERRSEIRLNAIRLIYKIPQMSTRQLAEKIGISNGSAYYVISALVEKGFVKVENFKRDPRKRRYAYLLTPKGIKEKSLLTRSFIKRKQLEFEKLKAEINALEKEAALDKKLIIEENDEF